MTGGPDRQRNRFSFYLFFVMIAYALSVTMIGPLMGSLMSTYGLDRASGGLFLTFQSIGGVIAILAGGFFADRVKKSFLIGLCFLLFGLSLVLAGLRPSYPVLLAAFLLTGASTRLLDAVANALIADLHPGSRGAWLNLLHTFFGVGGFLGPLFAQLFLSRNVGWDGVFLALGCIVLALLLPFPFFSRNIDPPRVSGPRSAGTAGQGNTRTGEPAVGASTPGFSASPFGSRSLWIICAIMFMYVAHQAAVTVWLPLYMETQLGSTTATASLAASLFWIGIIAGRLLGSAMERRAGAVNLLIYGGFAGGLLLTAAIASGNTEVLVVATGLSGLLTGAVIPLLMAIATGLFPARSGTVSSVILLAGTFSRMSFPYLVGVIADGLGFPAGFSLSGLTLFGVFLLSLALVSRVRRT